MVNFIDRRLNPKDKSLGNRRRFIRRVRSYVKRAVDEAVRERGIADADRSETVTVPTDSIQEPHFHHSSAGGRRERVLPGNKQFRTGDQIAKPPSGGGGGRGQEGSPDGEGEDDFVFVLSRDEFLDIFFEDLELPDLVKKSLQEISAAKPRRAGISVSGAPANLNVGRTMRNALGRRIALRRPSDAQAAELRERIFALEAVHDPSRRAARRADRAARRARDASSAPEADPLARPARRPLQPLRAAARAELERGDVLPDGRLGLDGRSARRTSPSASSSCCIFF